MAGGESSADSEVRRIIREEYRRTFVQRCMADEYADVFLAAGPWDAEKLWGVTTTFIADSGCQIPDLLIPSEINRFTIKKDSTEMIKSFMKCYWKGRKVTVT